MSVRKMGFLGLTLICVLALAGAVSAQDDGPANQQFEDSELAGMSWDEIVAAADGSEVNWFMWGGSDRINRFVVEFIGGILKDEYNITMNQVHSGAGDTLNILLGEREAGVDSGGSVDLIWINGENFRTLKQGGLAFCGYTHLLPSMANVNPDDQTILSDFGTPVDGCEVPWGRAQVAIIVNTDLVPEPPIDMDALLAYACENPGLLTYPALPDFTGSVFVRHVFYNEADKIYADEGGYRKLLGPFVEEVYAPVAEATWNTLNEVEPCLWRSGETYPNNNVTQEQLYANTEVGFLVTYGATSVGANIDDGLYPPSTDSYVLESGTIGNVNFTAIPYNASNKAAAMVLANTLLSVRGQLQSAQPEVWGSMPVLDPRMLTDEERAGFDAIPSHPSHATPAELAAAALPELLASWLIRIEEDWRTNVLEN